MSFITYQESRALVICNDCRKFFHPGDRKELGTYFADEPKLDFACDHCGSNNTVRII